MNRTTIDRTGFTFYKSYSDIYFKLNHEQKVSFIDAILTHQLTHADIDDFSFEDAFLDIAWLGVKPNLHSNKIKYINGSKPKSEANNKRNRSETEANNKRSANNDNDNVNDKDNENDNEKNKALDRFESFWNNYPKKTDKKKTRVSFIKLSKEKQTLAVSKCKNQYSSREKQYIPAPLVYLNGEKWDDELDNNNQANNKITIHNW